MIIEILLLLDQIPLILPDPILLLEVLSVNGRVDSMFVFGLLDYSFADLVLCEILVVFVFEVHFEDSVDDVVDVGPLVGEDF